MSTNAIYKFILITKIEARNVWYHYPSKIKRSLLNHVKPICHSFKNQHSGLIQTKNENYYYSTYSPNNSKDKIFVFLITEPACKDKDAYSLLNSLFEAFNVEKINPNEPVNSFSDRTKALLNKTFDLYSKGAINENIIDISNKSKGNDIEIELQEVKDEDSKKEKDKESLIEEESVDNRLLSNEEEQREDLELNERISENGGSVFIKDASQLQKVTWWRRMKMIFIIVCLIIAIGLYVSIPFLMRFKNNLSNNSNKEKDTDRLIRILPKK